MTITRSGPSAQSAGELRVQKDISEVAIPAVRLEFPNIHDQTNFNVHVSPPDGFWAGGTYCFNFVITGDYPHKPPKVTCKTNVYHPNIDLEGNVCLNILRDEWKPILTISQVIFGVLFLFDDPNSDDPLNREAAALMRSNRVQFANTVKRTLQGYSHEGRSYQKFL